MEQDFDICVEDDYEPLSKFAVEENKNSVELYDWQRRAIRYFMQHHRTIFEVTTGAGKTFCAIEIIKRLNALDPNLRVLIVVPKNVILETTWYKELYANGFSLSNIGVYYGFAKEYGKITITNMQNINKIALEIFDLVIWDEIHNYGTRRLLKYLQHPFKYMIGLSATIERMDRMHHKIMEIFDYNIFKYTPSEALAEGVLNPFNFYDIAVDLDDETQEKYNTMTKDINLMMQMGGGYYRIMRENAALKFKLLAKMNERKELVNNYDRKFEVAKIILNRHKDDKVLIFNQFNKQTNKFYWHLLDIGISARIVHSGIEAEKRDEAIRDFKNDKCNVILTTKVLDEGWNMPAVDCGIIMAGDSTAKQTIQRLGRVLRKKSRLSNLFQVYCKGTIEEDYARERAKLFKELCHDYRGYNYDGKTDFLLEVIK